MTRRGSKLDSVTECRYDIFYPRNEKFLCFYCGCPSDTLDHVPPITRVYDYESYNLEREIYVKVPSCKECNDLAGNSLQDSIINRCQHIKAKITRRYRNVLNYPEWLDSEIDALEDRGILQGDVHRLSDAQEEIERRIDYSVGINEFVRKYNI